MKNLKFLTLPLVAFILLFTSCSKTNNSASSNDISMPDVATLARQTYHNEEKACITGNCAGTKCVAVAQGFCKKARDCEAVPGGCVELVQEILDNVDMWSAEHANYMIANDFYDDDPENWDLSYNLAHTILIE